METAIKINGMTCGHCEGRVSKELTAIEGVSAAAASAERAEAVITSSAPISMDAIANAVRKAGYTVVG